MACTNFTYSIRRGLKIKPLSVLIVGCGAIAGGYDEHLEMIGHPRTHVNGFKKDGRFQVNACVDSDEINLIRFGTRWGIKNLYQNIESIEENIIFDVVSVCTPTNQHLKSIEEALRLRPKIIFCEKPLTESIKDSMYIEKLCRDQGVMLMVNFSRRWDPSIDELRLMIESKSHGALRSVTAIYNKGLSNNGSHLIDVFSTLFGSNMALEYVGDPIYDYLDSDPSFPFVLKTENQTLIQVSCGNAKDYSVFEINFIFADGVVAMEQGGEFWRERRKMQSNIFSGYLTLSKEKVYRGKYSEVMTNAINNIYDYLIMGRNPLSTFHNAISTQTLINRIRDKKL